VSDSGFDPRRTAIPLSGVDVGSCVRLRSVNAGHGLRARLAAMGLTPGAELQVVRNTPGGPFIIAVRDSRLMLGRGMAERIEVVRDQHSA